MSHNIHDNIRPNMNRNNYDTDNSDYNNKDNNYDNTMVFQNLN